jgi:hypothetical protein
MVQERQFDQERGWMGKTEGEAERRNRGMGERE